MPCTWPLASLLRAPTLQTALSQSSQTGQIVMDLLTLLNPDGGSLINASQIKPSCPVLRPYLLHLCAKDLSILSTLCLHAFQAPIHYFWGRVHTHAKTFDGKYGYLTGCATLTNLRRHHLYLQGLLESFGELQTEDVGLSTYKCCQSLLRGSPGIRDQKPTGVRPGSNLCFVYYL